MNKDYSEYAKMTQNEVYDAIFNGYERKQNRVKEIFDLNSEMNKRLNLLAEVYGALIPDLSEEFEKRISRSQSVAKIQFFPLLRKADIRFYRLSVSF